MPNGPTDGFFAGHCTTGADKQAEMAACPSWARVAFIFVPELLCEQILALLFHLSEAPMGSDKAIPRAS